MPSLNLKAFESFLKDKRRNAVLVGPGAGIKDRTRALAKAALAADVDVRVLDADALTVFKSSPNKLLDRIDNKTIITPHDGEFDRLFDASGDRLSRARAAADACGGVVVLKGPDTVIAKPGGIAVINPDQPATLATAGTGDVLAGLALGFGAQGADAFDAACMGAWIHARAADDFGLGLIAEDLADGVPEVLDGLVDFLRVDRP